MFVLIAAASTLVMMLAKGLEKNTLCGTVEGANDPFMMKQKVPSCVTAVFAGTTLTVFAFNIHPSPRLGSVDLVIHCTLMCYPNLYETLL